MAENKKKRDNTCIVSTSYPTDDLYYVAAVKALFGIDDYKVVIVEADLYGKKKKCTAIYENHEMPTPSSILSC